MTETDLFNHALGMIGINPVANIDDLGTIPETGKRMFNAVSDSVLRSRPWNCALRRQTLNVVTNPADIEFSHAFQLPTDPYCLRVIRIADLSARHRFRVEGRLLLTDQSSVKILYIARVPVSDYDPLLFDAVATRLGSELAGPLARDFSMAKNLLEVYLEKFAEAAGVDDAEGGMDEDLPTDLVTIRNG